MNNIIDKIRNTRILAAIGIICLILGTFLAYYTFSFFGYTESLSLWGYWEGKIVLILAVANLLFIFKDLIEKYTPSLFNSNLGRKISEINNPKLSLIPTILSVIFIVYLQINLNVSSSYVSHGLGFYLLWIGIICLVLYAILHKKTEG